MIRFSKNVDRLYESRFSKKKTLLDDSYIVTPATDGRFGGAGRGRWGVLRAPQVMRHIGAELILHYTILYITFVPIVIISF